MMCISMKQGFFRNFVFVNAIEIQNSDHISMSFMSNEINQIFNIFLVATISIVSNVMIDGNKI